MDCMVMQMATALSTALVRCHTFTADPYGGTGTDLATIRYLQNISPPLDKPRRAYLRWRRRCDRSSRRADAWAVDTRRPRQMSPATRQL
jgi:hypothetical protein